MTFSSTIRGLSVLVFASTATALVTNITGFAHLNARASYNLVDNYDSGNFFNSFNFFTGNDPTHGYVNYQSQPAAASQGLINANNGQIYMGVDSTTFNPPAGRASVRATSNKAYTHGLFIADIAHMPGDVCGVWPAFWLFGGNWPNQGEIDVIEGVSMSGTDTITLHTAAGCNVNTAGSQSGTSLSTSNCNQDNGNSGCSSTTATSNAYGDSFNNIGGGVYAMQWESSGIYVWFFPRESIPADIQDGRPVTGNWGTPVVAFNGGGGCNIDQYFSNHNIVFDTTFCGDWAGNVWGNSQCASKANTCTDYVAGNPGAFAPAFWSINSVKVYQQW